MKLPSWPSVSGWAVAYVLSLLMVVMAPVSAQSDVSSAKVLGVKLVPIDEPERAWEMAAEFDISLGKRLNNALDRGLPLVFSVDFILTRSRWYWMPEEVIKIGYPIELSYHALTRSYRVSSAAATESFATLSEAIAAMGQLKAWRVIPASAVQTDQPYQANVRLRLDVTELPKPFQVNALVDDKWILSSEWLEFEFTPRASKRP